MDNKKVILSFPDPSEWTFMSFVTESGKDVTNFWDTDQSFEAEQSFRSLIKANRKISDHRQWTSWRHSMKGKAGKAGVVELGFKADKKQYRVLCMFRGKKCIVVLCIAYHKGSVWTPRDAVELATKRAYMITSNKAKLNVIQIENNL